MLYKKMRGWGWYKDSNTKSLFIELLLIANYEPSIFEGRPVARGQCIVGINKLGENTGLTVSQVRTALNKLKMTNEIAIETTNQYSIITIINYDSYQKLPDESSTQNRTQDDKPITNQSQTDDKQIATSNEFNELKKRNKENKNTNTAIGEPSSASAFSSDNNNFNPPTRTEAAAGVLARESIHRADLAVVKTVLGLPAESELRCEEFYVVWGKWLKHLHEKKIKVSETSTTEILIELSTLGLARSITAINHSISRNWNSINEKTDWSVSGKRLEHPQADCNFNNVKKGKYDGLCEVVPVRDANNKPL